MENNKETNDKPKRIRLQNKTVNVLSKTKTSAVNTSSDVPFLFEKILIYKTKPEIISSYKVWLDKDDLPKWIRNEVNHSAIEQFMNLVKSGSIYQVNSLTSAFNSLKFAPVNAFKYAPMANNWAQLMNNNIAVDINKNYYAEITKYFGYFMKICYLRICANRSRNFLYNNFSQRNLFPIEKSKKTLPTEFDQQDLIQNTDISVVLKQNKRFLTLKKDIQTLFNDCLEQFDKSYVFEVFDKNAFYCCQIIDSFGTWQLVRLLNENDSNQTSKTFWVHPKSGLLRPPGWSQIIGCLICAPVSYQLFSQYSWTFEAINKYIVNPNCFLFEPDIENNFPIGSFLELLDPFNHQMKFAVVSKKYNFGFMLLEFNIFDVKEDINRDYSCKIVQHVTSRIIFPIGYSTSKNIPIFLNNTTKYNQTNMPDLTEFLNENAAEEKLFPIYPFGNELFKSGMILETFNIIGEGVISYAIIVSIIDRLIQLRFINHDPLLKLWVEEQSTNIMPFGYAHMIQVPKSASLPLFIDNIRLKEFHIIAKN